MISNPKRKVPSKAQTIYLNVYRSHDRPGIIGGVYPSIEEARTRSNKTLSRLILKISRDERGNINIIPITRAVELNATLIRNTTESYQFIVLRLGFSYLRPTDAEHSSFRIAKDQATSLNVPCRIIKITRSKKGDISFMTIN